ncbi:hypothetical protein [Gluconobacter albidus]|uniref:hypothetical protein n=1 Tax=Gluconobacter albidus TaxID=318683 RepID=UPI000AAA50F3|nr:hypothetical protein [Gluconobacter albidus]
MSPTDKDSVLKFGVSLLSINGGSSTHGQSTANQPDTGYATSGDGISDIPPHATVGPSIPSLGVSVAHSPGGTMTMSVGLNMGQEYSNIPVFNIPQNVYFDGKLINDSISYIQSTNNTTTEAIDIPIPDGTYNGNQVSGLHLTGLITGKTNDFSWGFGSSSEAVQAYAQDLANIGSEKLHNEYAAFDNISQINNDIAQSWSLLQHKW